MATIKERLVFEGTLRGNGREATCIVDALKISISGADPPGSLQFSVRQTSKSLPDGIYQLFVDGLVVDVRHEGLFWIAP